MISSCLLISWERDSIKPAQKHKKLKGAKILLVELKVGTTEQKIVFSNEKLFTNERTVNN